MYKAEDHTFALCAYGKSRYLEDCIVSLKNQTVQSNILISTSTPSEYIQQLAEKHRIPVFINEGEKGIGADWNYAYRCAATGLVTIAHQDDIYEPEYTQQMLAQINQEKDPILWFCDYCELRNGEKVYANKNLKIKRVMLFPLRGKLFRNSDFVRRRILSIGNAICCPSVTHVKKKTGQDICSLTMKVSLDGDPWDRQSKKNGAFLYCAKPLMCHRIHEESATTALIASKTRREEDLEMFRRFWPDGVAKRIAKYYSASENSNSAS